MKAEKTLKIIGTLIAILVGVATLWQIFKPGPQLTAQIISVKAPLPPELEDRINQLDEISLEQIRKRGDWQNLENMQDEEIMRHLDFYKILVAHQEKHLKEYSLFGDPYLSVITVQNQSITTLDDVIIRGMFLNSAYARIERESGENVNVKSSKKLDLGKLSPKEIVNIYVYNAFDASLLSSISIHHSNGEGKITGSTQVALHMLRDRGIYFSWQILTYILLALLLLLILGKVAWPHIRNIFNKKA